MMAVESRQVAVVPAGEGQGADMVLIRRGHTLPSAHQWDAMLGMADAMLKTGLLPQTIKTPQAAVVLIMKGAELGIPPMQALSQIVVVNGKPSLQSELMAALIYRDHGDDALQFDSTAERCMISYKRRTATARGTFTFTLEDARRAGLLTTQTWTKYPAAMLRARAISAVARMIFPDSIGGMHSPEELGAPVTVRDGEVVADGDGSAPPQLPAPVDDMDGLRTELRGWYDRYPDREQQVNGFLKEQGKGWSDSLVRSEVGKMRQRAADEEAQRQQAAQEAAVTDMSPSHQLAGALEVARKAVEALSKKKGGPNAGDYEGIRVVLREIQRCDPLPDDTPPEQIPPRLLLDALRTRLAVADAGGGEDGAQAVRQEIDEALPF